MLDSWFKKLFRADRATAGVIRGQPKKIPPAAGFAVSAD